MAKVTIVLTDMSDEKAPLNMKVESDVPFNMENFTANSMAQRECLRFMDELIRAAGYCRNDLNGKVWNAKEKGAAL